MSRIQLDLFVVVLTPRVDALCKHGIPSTARVLFCTTFRSCVHSGFDTCVAGTSALSVVMLLRRHTFAPLPSTTTPNVDLAALARLVVGDASRAGLGTLLALGCTGHAEFALLARQACVLCTARRFVLTRRTMSAHASRRQVRALHARGVA